MSNLKAILYLTLKIILLLNSILNFKTLNYRFSLENRSSEVNPKSKIFKSH